ncbi:hypothetical protein C8T65DRAFT_739090 [Cerioporus squamosus]|nr:hypothetical protein C8T65DRAFT_739090 [Cerioporus squamosus]
MPDLAKVIAEFYETEKSLSVVIAMPDPIIVSLDTPHPALTRAEITCIFSNIIEHLKPPLFILHVPHCLLELVHLHAPPRPVASLIPCSEQWLICSIKKPTRDTWSLVKVCEDLQNQVAVFAKKVSIIGFNVGGTSTDVSQFVLDINTVVAEGGSCLSFRNQQVQAPSLVQHVTGGALAVADANPILGRLVRDYVTKIFGKSEKELPDIQASHSDAFHKLAEEIKTSVAEDKEMGLDEIVYGSIKVANETMARPIHALTKARGYAMSKHM